MRTNGSAKIARRGRTGLVAPALTALLALGTAGAANASLLTDTIELRAGHSAVCTATNAGKTRIEVTIDVIESNESVNGPATCSLGPQEFCLQEILAAGADRFIFCRVAASGSKIHGVLMDRDSGITSQAR